MCVCVVCVCGEGVRWEAGKFNKQISAKFNQYMLGRKKIESKGYLSVS